MTKEMTWNSYDFKDCFEKLMFYFNNKYSHF